MSHWIQTSELTYLGEVFGRIRLYREWSFGRHTPPRRPQPADLPNDFLGEDGRNLGLIFLQEGAITIPATRLSDGTLRYLCLLAILCHPTPPPLVCIEEPELGLHPDILPSLNDLLHEASERCQLVVTTHSDILVDALTDTPDAVVVCEKHAGQTELRRLDKTDLTALHERGIMARADIPSTSLRASTRQGDGRLALGQAARRDIEAPSSVGAGLLAPFGLPALC